jgi:uncharacterized protein (DUF1330 family)
MAAYIISRVDVKDPERMKDYAVRSIALAKTYGATYPVRTNRVEALEGTYDGRRLIIIQFPDLVQARAYGIPPNIRNCASCGTRRPTVNSGWCRRTDVWRAPSAR